MSSGDYCATLPTGTSMPSSNLLTGSITASLEIGSGAIQNAGGLTTGQMKIFKVWVFSILSNIG